MRMKKGFTLVEVVAALAVMAVVGLIISSIYISIMKYDINKKEKTELQAIISNIHELYLADPERWQSGYYELYGLAFPAPHIAAEQRLIFDRDFALLAGETGSYTLYYDYGYSEAADVYSLKITRILKGDKELLGDINLGRWKKVGGNGE